MMQMKLFWLATTILTSGNIIGAQVLLLDQLDGKSVNLAASERSAQVSEASQFVTTQWDRGYLSGSGENGRCLSYPGKGNFNPERGAVEFFVELGSEFGKYKKHEHLATLMIDRHNAIGIYYNYQEKNIIFWIRNDDYIGKNRNQKDYCAFLVSPKLDWRPGEHHHIALTYEPDHQLLLLDGKALRWQEYYGSLTANWGEDSRIEIARDSNFIIDAVRVWDDAYFSRRVFAKPSLAVPGFLQDHFPTASQIDSMNLAFGQGVFSFAPEQPMPTSLVADHRQLLPQKSAIMLDGKAVKWQGNMQKSTSQAINGNFAIVGEKEITVSAVAEVADGNLLKYVLTFHNSGNSVWKKDITLALGALAAENQAFVTTTGAPFALKTGNSAYANGVFAISGIGGKPNFSLPVMSTFSREQNIGFSVAQPMAVKERIAVDFGGETENLYMTMTNFGVGIAPGEKREMIYYFLVHPGDFRPSLQLMMDIDPEAFVPGTINPARQQTIDNGMIIGGPSDPAFLDRMSRYMVGYREITIGNGKQIVFGEYVPELPDDDSLKHYAQINQQIAALHQAGILGMIYLQARECQRLDYAKEKFPQSVQYDVNGNLILSYSYGTKMLCRKNSDWYNHLLMQLDQSLAKMPAADGVFFDNCWDLEYADIINAFGEKLHRRGLLLATNGISNPCAKVSDSIMAEGTRNALTELCFYGLAKPVTYVPINAYNGFGFAKEREIAAPSSPESLEKDLKACLLFGAFYSLNYRGDKYFGEESLRIFQSYLPLQKEMRGKIWYLQSHALELPPGFLGNIYRQPDDGLVAFAVSEGTPFTGEMKPSFSVVIDVGGRKISTVMLRHLEDATEKQIPFQILPDNRIKVIVSDHISISMLKLK